MSSYWNKKGLSRILSSISTNKPIKYEISTNAGRFYFYFKKESDSKARISGKVIFFPK